ncbi:MAG: choice-of-anchor P family protein, partial [Candidatus Binatia bacterium]
MGLAGLDRNEMGWRKRAARAIGLAVAGLAVAATAPANAQICGPTPACTDAACARGRAVGSFAALGGTDIGPLRTADTGCQATLPQDDFFDVSAEGSTIPAAPLANVVTSESRTRGDARRERFVQSRSGNAIAEVIPPTAPGGSALLEVVTSGSEVSICGDVATGTSGIDLLTIAGTPVPIPGTVAPNTTITSPAFPLLILNEQVCQDGSHPAGGCAACAPTAPDANGCSTLACTVNALH